MNISRKFDKVTIEPAELPDLTPLDFFWRGHATNRAYVKSQNCIPLIYYYLKVYREDFEPLHILFLYKISQNLVFNKIQVICVPRPKSASFSSETEFAGRGAAEA
jgi:hypothetical protein